MKRFLSAIPLLLLGGCASISTSRQDAIPPELVGRDLPVTLARLESQGRVSEAEAWIDRSLKAQGTTNESLVIERERLARLSREFSQSPEDLLGALRKSIPDATAADIERWHADGLIQSLEIDGQRRYFRKEPRNLFRVSSEARQRRDAAAKVGTTSPSQGDPNTKQTERFDLHEQVELALAESDRTGTKTPRATRIHATHKVTVRPGTVPPGETVRCWIPFPQEYGRQKGVELLATIPPEHSVAPNGTPQRTVYLEQKAGPAEQPIEFQIEYRYSTSAFIPAIDPARVVPLPPDSPVLAQYTANAPPHAELTPAIRTLAAEIVGEEKNPYLAADRIFRWIDGNFQYCSEMEYSVMTSISEKAINQRRGDCGVHALLFISLCRAAGIPARWQSGWAMRPGSENLHDWTEFYVEPYGWLPADPSFGLRDHKNPRVRDFYIGHIDQFRMIANLDYDAPLVPPKNHWRSDNIDNQRGEVEWSGGNLYFDQWDYKMTVEYEFD